MQYRSFRWNVLLKKSDFVLLNTIKFVQQSRKHLRKRAICKRRNDEMQ